MPRKDSYHDQVRAAIVKDGWTITHDPYLIRVGRRKGYIDLGAEKLLIAAQKETERIAVEIKSFLGASDLDQFEDALGQFIVYLNALEEKDPGRVLYLAVPSGFYNRFFDDPFFVRLANRYEVKMIIFDETAQVIESWIK